MRTLRQRDLRLLVALLDCFDHVDAHEFPHHAAVGVHTLVGGTMSSYNEVGPGGAAVAAAEPQVASSGAEAEAFTQYAWQHPVLARFHAAGTHPARAISDYASRRELERSDLYNHVYRPLGITDQISVAIRGPGSLMTALAVNRGRRGFTEREQLLLDLLRPHLASGRASAERLLALRQARGALEAAATPASRRAVVVLTRSGGVAWATPLARGLMREWFDYRSGTRLPDQLARWMAACRANRLRVASRPVDDSLRVVRGDRALVATLLAPAEPEGERLLTFEQSARLRREQLIGLGLTPREGEVLAAAARGLGEDGIARELAISRRTVNKHLERAYRKLGVTDRAQAIAAAFDAADRS